MFAGPVVHLLHRGQLVVQRNNLRAEDRSRLRRIGAGPAMIVEIGLGTSADCVQVFGFQSLLKLFVHTNLTPNPFP